MANELGKGYITIEPDAKGFGPKLEKELVSPSAKAGAEAGKKAGDEFGKGAQSGVTKFGATVTKNLKDAFGPAAIAGTFAIGIASIVKFAGDAVDAASSLNEEISKSGVVFDGAAGEVQSWATTASDSFGQSERAALAAANQFGVMFTAMGKGSGEAAALSMQMTELASDMASFNNASPEEAILAIGAAMRGEMEPIRRFGVLLDDATLRQEALSQGLITTTSQALTPAQKAMAAYGQILKQTAMQQGDFERTQDGAANQLRILSAKFDEFKVAVGQAVLPLITAMVPALAKFMALAEPVVDVIAQITTNLFEWDQSTKGAVVGAQALSDTLKVLKLDQDAGTDAILRGIQAYEASFGPGHQFSAMWQAQKQAVMDYSVAQGAATAAALAGVPIMTGLAASTTGVASASTQAAAAAQAQAAQADALAGGYIAAKAALDNYIMSMLAASDSQLALEQSAINVADAWASEQSAAQTLGNAVDDTKTSVDEAAAADRNYQSATIATKQAINAYSAQALQTAAAQRGLTVEQLGGAEKSAILRSALQSLAAANPPLQGAIQQTINKLSVYDGTNAQATMSVNDQASGPAAAISRALDNAARARTAVIHVIERSGVAGSGIGQGGGGAADGTIVPGPYSQASPGWTLHGQEMVLNPKQQSRVANAMLWGIANGDSPRGGDGGSVLPSRPIEVVINLDSRQMARALVDPLRQATRERT